MDCSTLGFPVLHHLSEFAQTHLFSWCFQNPSAHYLEDHFFPVSHHPRPLSLEEYHPKKYIFFFFDVPSGTEICAY